MRERWKPKSWRRKTERCAIYKYRSIVTSNESWGFQVNVANRVQFIHDHTSPAQWRHVESRSNPADEGSRGLNAKDFVRKSQWIKGPELLVANRRSLASTSIVRRRNRCQFPRCQKGHLQCHSGRTKTRHVEQIWKILQLATLEDCNSSLFEIQTTAEVNHQHGCEEPYRKWNPSGEWVKARWWRC